MTDWSGALAKAFEKHLERCFRGFRVSEREKVRPINALIPTCEKPTLGMISVPAVSEADNASLVETAETTAAMGAVSKPVSKDIELRGSFPPPRSTGNTRNRGNTSDAGIRAFKSEDFEERAAMIEYEARVSREWVEGFAKLNVRSAPAEFTQEFWEQLVDDGGKFLDRWAKEATRLGWTAADIFGIASPKPIERYRRVGLAYLIGGGEVVDIGTGRATIRRKDGALITYLKRAPKDAEPIWQLL